MMKTTLGQETVLNNWKLFRSYKPYKTLAYPFMSVRHFRDDFRA